MARGRRHGRTQEHLSAAERHAIVLRHRLAEILNPRGGRTNIPDVRIGSTSPQAKRRKINRTAKSQDSRINITSGANQWIPELYGKCSPKPHMFAVGMDGPDLIFGLWCGFGEIEEYTEILINGAAVPGAVTVEEYKGTTVQGVSPILSNLSGYAHDLVIDVNGTDRGMAYLAFRVPPGAVDGFPKVSVKIKGNCKIEDTRTATTAYSDVPALCWRHWIKTAGAGPEWPVNDSSFEALADFNEEVPGDVWIGIHNYSLLDFAKPTGANSHSRVFEVTTDNGLSGAGEPAWNFALGATTNDGGLIWTCRDGRRHVCGVITDVQADIDSWMETWRTLCGCMYIFSETGIEAIPDHIRATDHVFKYEDGQIQNNLALKQTKLRDRPTVVQITYTNTQAEPWRDATVRVAAAGVDAGTTRERLSSVKVPGIHRTSQAIRLGIERLNAATLTDLSFPLHVFDEGLKVRAGDVIEVTDPIGLTDKKMRVLDAHTTEPGRWLLDLWEYDPAVYSNHVETESTYPDFDLNSGVGIDFAQLSADCQDQIDGKIISWFQVTDPQPGWSGTDASHEGDMWWNTTTKKLKRWSGVAWSSNIEDQIAIDAYADAATAQDTADGKRRVFTATPTTPYDVGDLWSAGPGGDIKKCKTARSSGAYQAGDWELASNYDNTAASSFVTSTYPADQSDLQDQIDGKIISWFQSSNPQPGWAGSDASHAGDMWWNTSTNQLKRWSGSAWSANIEDQKAIDAYADAATAQDTADGKRRVFTAQPTTPYDIGDLWSAGPSGDIKKCKTARGSGAYQAGDWELASGYDATPSLPSDEDLVCYLSCNAGTGTSVLDESGRGNSGTLANDAWNNGISGKGLDFNSIDDECDIANTSDINLMDVTLRTFSLWVKADATVDRQMLFKEGGVTNGISIYIDTNVLYFVYWTSGVLVGYCYREFTYTDWQHIVCVFDSVGGFQAIYRNGMIGTAAGWADDKSTTVLQHSGGIDIGYSGDNILDHTGATDSGDNYFAGVIDELRIYNKKLTLQESKALYNTSDGISSPMPGATEGATWGSDITDQPDDALLLNELNCVGGYQEVPLPKENGEPCCIDCYINNNGSGRWFKVAEFNLAGTYKTCTWNGLFNWGSSDGRYTDQMRVRLSAQTNGAGSLTATGWQYSGDDLTSSLKMAYVGVVVTVYAYLGGYRSCLFDGAWSANVSPGNSWIHTKQDQTDNIGSGTPAGTYLTPTKNYTQGADITGDNDCQHPGDYTGSHTSNNTTYINGSINQSGQGNVQIYDDLQMQNGCDISFYSSSTYRGGIYGTADGVGIVGTNDVRLIANGGYIKCDDTVHPTSDDGANLGRSIRRWLRLYVTHLDRPYSTSGRMKLYDKTTGDYLDEWRYEFTS